MSGSPFDHERDTALGKVLRRALSADDDAAFTRRVLARLPEPARRRAGASDWWEVLGGWARPGLAAAVVGMIAALSFWLTGVQAPREAVVLESPLRPVNETFVTNALLTTTRPPEVDVVFGMALEDVPER